jgi:hypothetical protein
MEKLPSFAVIKKEIFPIFPVQRNKKWGINFTNYVVFSGVTITNYGI